jgi:hypothetical protein
VWETNQHSYYTMLHKEDTKINLWKSVKSVGKNNLKISQFENLKMNEISRFATLLGTGFLNSSTIQQIND